MIYRFYAQSKSQKRLLAGCLRLMENHMAFYYSPREMMIRFKTRVMNRATYLAAEMEELGLKVTKKYDYD